MFNLISLAILFSVSYFCVRLFRLRNLFESILTFFLLSIAQICLSGYIASWCNHLRDIRYWTIISFALLIILLAISFFSATARNAFFSIPRITDSEFRIEFKNETFFEKILLILLGATVVVIGLMNISVVFFTAPHNWDSMTYHLARVAYYLQNNNLDYFDANYYAQTVHPKNATLILTYLYLISFKNENFFQLMQFISYWIAIISIYLTALSMYQRHSQALFSGLIFALLTECLMESTTTQNDMLMAALTGVNIYFLIASSSISPKKYLCLSALGISLALGTKASYLLVLPVLFFIFICIRSPNKKRASLVFSGAIVFCCLFFTLPAGYWDNYRKYQHPIGGQWIRQEHSFEGRSFEHIMLNGTKNFFRYWINFLSIDGFVASETTHTIQKSIRKYPTILLQKLGLDLESQDEIRIAPFNINAPPVAHEDYSYWGILGFAIVWPAVFFALPGGFSYNYIKIFCFCSLLYLVCQSYSGPYDPWRGRYFLICAVFCTPVSGIWLRSKSKIIQGYLLLIIILGSVSGVSAILFRSGSNLIAYQDNPSIFQMNRMQQLTRNRPKSYEPLKKFDQIVPKNATVAAFLGNDTYEYPLFGEKLTRTIIPVSATKGVLPPDVKADYMLYINASPVTESDTILGYYFFLHPYSLSEKNN